MKLITELFENMEYITEAKENGEKEHYIHGIFLQANRKNRNGRVYPIHVMENEVNRYMTDVVNNNDVTTADVTSSRYNSVSGSLNVG